MEVLTSIIVGVVGGGIAYSISSKRGTVWTKIGAVSLWTFVFPLSMAFFFAPERLEQALTIGVLLTGIAAYILLIVEKARKLRADRK